MPQVQQVATPIGVTREAAWLAVANALIANGVSAPATLLLVAELELEHGRGFPALYNYNVGNVKLQPSRYGAVPYYVLTDRTGSTDAYQAYTNLTDGLKDYVYEMVTRRPSAYRAAVNQDIDAYATTLYMGESGNTSDGYIGVPPYQSTAEAIASTRSDLIELVKEGTPFFRKVSTLSGLVFGVLIAGGIYAYFKYGRK
jgi:hypothetical protein